MDWDDCWIKQEGFICMLLSLLFEMTPKWSDKYNYFVFLIKLYQITVPGPCLILFPIIYPYCYTEIVLVCPCITRRLQGAELSRTKPYFGDTPSSLPWVSWSSDSLSSLSFKEEHSQDVGRGRWLVIVKQFYQGFSSLFIVRLGGGVPERHPENASSYRKAWNPQPEEGKILSKHAQCI